LEFCCGSAMYVNRLPQTFKHYTGIDLDQQAIASASFNAKNKNAMFICASATNFKYVKNFDICMGTLALHEIDIKEQGLALKNIIDHTKKNGLIVIYDPYIAKNCFQELWNIVYREFISFERNFTIKNSEFVIDTAIKQGYLVKELEKKVNLPIEIENMNEIYNMFLSCPDFKDTFKSQQNIIRLKTIVDNYFKENNITNVIYDKLKLTILKKI